MSRWLSTLRNPRQLSVGFVAASLAVFPAAYEGDIHQELTFVAAGQYNRCAEDTHLATLTPLEVRYIAIANANQADAAWWRRMFRWNYYNRGNQSPPKFLWLFDTRMHNHYRSTLRRLDEARDLSRRFTNLGRVINYLQDATTPVHVVPVYAARWWRFSVSDRFNGFPVDADAVTAALGDDCSSMRSTDVGFENLLVATAERTVDSVTESIPGLPVSWGGVLGTQRGFRGLRTLWQRGQQLRPRGAFPMRPRGRSAQELRACPKRPALPGVRAGTPSRRGKGDDRGHGDDAGASPRLRDPGCRASIHRATLIGIAASVSGNRWTNPRVIALQKLRGCVAGIVPQAKLLERP